jgi:hypothetical protein
VNKKLNKSKIKHKLNKRQFMRDLQWKTEGFGP